MVNLIQKQYPGSISENTFSAPLAGKLERAFECASRIFAKTAHSPAKPMFPQYHPELIDSKHRYAKLLFPYFKQWKEDVESHLSFNEWLEKTEKTDPRLAQLPQVNYLNEIERAEHEIHLTPDGRAYTAKEGMLNTSEDPKHPHIYVISPEGKMYVGSRDNGHFNHSSFLGGRPVICAGELRAKDGKVEVITDTSGHYKTFLRPEMLSNGVRAMIKIGLDKFQVKSQAKLKNEKTFGDATVFLDAYDRYFQLNQLKKEYSPLVGMSREFAEDEVKTVNSWMIWKEGNTVMITKKTSDGYLHERPKGACLADLKKTYGPNLISLSF